MPRRRLGWLIAAIAAVVAACWFGREVVFGWGEPHPGDYADDAKSTDLPRDIALMWETRELSGTPDATHGPNARWSTDRAINAASRVFNTVELVGRTRTEVEALLGDPKASSESIYNFAFWPAAAGAMVYRFDGGAYGWQFDVVLGEDGRVVGVERRWIH